MLVRHYITNAVSGLRPPEILQFHAWSLIPERHLDTYLRDALRVGGEGCCQGGGIAAVERVFVWGNDSRGSY